METENKFDFKAHFEPGEKEKVLVIRYDDPLKVHDPEKVVLEGVITTPSEFVTKRGDLVDPKKSYVEFSKKELSITLTVNEADKFKTIVKGKLVRNPFLNMLRINTSQPFGVAELRKALQFAPIHFKDRDRHKSLMFSLSNYKAKVEKTVEEFNDRKEKTKGSSVKKSIVEVSQDFVFDFILFTPLFLGGPKVEIPITVAMEPGDGSVDLLLEYDDWEHVQEREIEAIFEQESKFFAAFAIVNKD